MRDALTKIIRWVMRDVRYLGQYTCAVQSQHADDTVDVLPDAAMFRGRGLSQVKIRHGLPGVRVRVSPSARCLLGFDGGDPSQPYVSLWDPGSVEQILFNGGTQGVARIGDMGVAYWPLFTATGLLNGAPIALTLAPLSPAVAIITTGSDKVGSG